eukprot:TRINITY_DN12759_c0_g1_i1.p1 TRINITY_DN12759_c0_g1~~TRINITY_DN12759_c0_g1_i1.p1  ORF type:complete len:179 (-),score=52.09 TRINITY_DN12759_c0_g1_i1:38-574(-)
MKSVLFFVALLLAFSAAGDFLFRDCTGVNKASTLTLLEHSVSSSEMPESHKIANLRINTKYTFHIEVGGTVSQLTGGNFYFAKSKFSGNGWDLIESAPMKLNAFDEVNLSTDKVTIDHTIKIPSDWQPGWSKIQALYLTKEAVEGLKEGATFEDIQPKDVSLCLLLNTDVSVAKKIDL